MFVATPVASLPSQDCQASWVLGRVSAGQTSHWDLSKLSNPSSVQNEQSCPSPPPWNPRQAHHSPARSSNLGAAAAVQQGCSYIPRYSMPVNCFSRHS